MHYTDENFDVEDRSLSLGPRTQGRYCTDSICCLIFLAAFGTSIWIAAEGYEQGDPYRLAYPYDPDNKICGISEGYENYPFIYWPKPIPGYVENTVCVSSCPVTGQELELDCKYNKLVQSCTSATYPQDVIGKTQEEIFSTGDFWVYPTVPIFGRICVPQQLEQFEFIKYIGLDMGLIREYLGDIYDVKLTILYSALIAVGLSIVFLILIRYCVGFMVWIVILVYFLTIAGLCLIFYEKYNGVNLMSEVGLDLYKNGIDSSSGTIVSEDEITGEKEENSQDALLPNEEQDKNNYKIATIILFIVFILSALILVCCLKKIQLTIAILKTATIFIKENMGIIFIPLLFFSFIICYFGYLVITYCYLYSTGERDETEWLPFAQFKFSDDDNSGFYNGLFYHSGSLAFGSLIISIIWFIQLILKYITKQAKKVGSDGTVKVAACLSCCVKCFERFIVFISEQAYTRMALTGNNFCYSSCGAFQIAISNPVRFALIDGLGNLFVVIGKCFVSTVTTYFGYLLVTKSDVKDKLSGFIFPCLIFFLAAFLVAEVFLKIYDISIDAILQCYLIDEKISEARGIHDNQRSPAPLREFFEKYETTNNQSKKIKYYY